MVIIKNFSSYYVQWWIFDSGAGGEGGFSKLVADNEKLRHENKSLKQLLRQQQQQGEISSKINSSLLMSVREEGGFTDDGEGSADERTNYRRVGNQYAPAQQQSRKQSQKRNSLENILKGSGSKGL